MFYIFEMANNHQGSLEHAKKIVSEFAKIKDEKNIEAAVKLQFRNLDTFIHKEYQESDLKFVKRFNSTKLTKSEFCQLVGYIHECGLHSMATPFDNESLQLIEDAGVQIVKVASCSVDDWPLLNDVSKINKRIIISTAGADFDILDEVYDMFKFNGRDFAFMHCVGEYPTPRENANLNRITLLQERFSDIEIGFSTHESPKEQSLAPIARSLGCKLLEKHVGVETDVISLNHYSCTPQEMSTVIDSVLDVEACMEGRSSVEKESLKALKRGAYLNKSLEEGAVLTEDDIYYSMPVQKWQMDASHLRELLNRRLAISKPADSPIYVDDLEPETDSILLFDIVTKVKSLLQECSIHLSGKETCEISAHYGIKNFFKIGALIIDKINRDYCKKLIVVLAGQHHPTHHHIQKEEAFELLHGDCELVLNGKAIKMELGKPVVIYRGVDHSFSSKNGCVVEEVSTTHVVGDSVYADSIINTLPVSDRKIKITLN